jgi:pimeloyl-ACP methyl ester carboxylesterase
VLARRLVLICTAAGGPSYLHAPGAIWRRDHPDYWRMGLPAALFWITRRRAPETLMLNAIFRASYADRTRFAPAAVAWRDWLRPGRPRLWWNQLARHLDFRDRLCEVRVPALVVAGRRDPQMPPACAEELARGIPAARLVVCEHSGHYPFLEEPTIFWAAAGAFLAAGTVC